MSYDKSPCGPAAVAPGRPGEADPAGARNLGAGRDGAAGADCLLAADGVSNTDIAEKVGATRTAVIT